MSKLNFNKLSYHYDENVDALLLKITSMYQYDVSLEVNVSTIIDLSKIGKVVCFEILDASRVLKIPVSALKKQPSFNITVDVNEDVIKAAAKMKPYYFILRDSSLTSDNVADNFDQIFQAYSKDTIRRIL